MKIKGAFFTFVLVALPELAISEGMTFEGKGNGGACYGGCFWIEAQGEILPETPNTAAIELERNGIPDLVFNSEGGDKSAGIELGRIIRKTGKNTRIGTSEPAEGGLMNFFVQTGPGVCRGACAIAFLGGKRTGVRGLEFDYVVEPGALLEFEPLLATDDLADFKSGSATGADRLEDQQLIGAFVKYLLDMGFSPRLYEVISRLAPGTTLQVDDDSLEAFRLLREGSYPDGWKLKVLGNGLAMQYYNVRLFCKGTADEMHLQLVYDKVSPDAPSDDPEICNNNDYACMSPSRLNYYKNQLSFSFDDGELPALYNGAYQAPSEGLPLLFDFLVNEDVIESLKTSAKIDVTYPTNSRPDLMALVELKNPLPGVLDHRFISLIKRNCL